MGPWEKLLRSLEESQKKTPKQEPKAAPKESGVVKPRGSKASKPPQG